MKTIRIGFGTPTSWFVPLAWAIWLFEWVRYNHIFFMFPEDNLAFQTTVAKGTEWLKLEEFLKTYNVKEAYEFELTEEEHDKIFAFCEKHKGKSYDLPQLIGVALARVFGFKKNIIASGDNKFDCAELLMLLMRANPGVFPGQERLKQDPDVVSLRDLHDFIAKCPKAKRVV